jgi:4-amino-4-deoxy-L-arabinose transferase-like glycosyltransferase
MYTAKPFAKHPIRWSILLPVILAAVVYLASANGRAVTDFDEGFYSQAARHMAESGDWITPYANGVRFLEKPPLLYWITAASFKVFGIHEFALRLPTALAVIALTWIVALMVGQPAGDCAVLAAGLSTAFSVGTYLFTRETLHDIWLVLFLSVAMYAFLEWYRDPKHPLRPALLFYAAMAGAVLSKSIIGAVFPLSIAAVFLLLSKEWPGWKTLHLLPGCALFCMLALPWHLSAMVRNKGFLEFFFIGEQFNRFLGRYSGPEVGSVPLPVFWILILVWFFPWVAFLPAAFAGSRKGMDAQQRILFRLAASWAVVTLVFFSFSARLEHYVFPALPALSLFVACALWDGARSRQVLWAFRSLAVLGILLAAIGGVVGILFVGRDPLADLAAGASDRIGSADFSIMAGMPAAVFSELIHPALTTLFAMAIGFGTALLFEKHQRRIHALVSVAAVMAVICAMIHWSLNICEDLTSSKKLALAVAGEARAGDRLVVVGDYESADSLNFYQPLQVEVVDGKAGTFPGDPKIVLTDGEYFAAWRSKKRVFVLTPKDRAQEYAPGGIEVITVLQRSLIRNR